MIAPSVGTSDVDELVLRAQLSFARAESRWLDRLRRGGMDRQGEWLSRAVRHFGAARTIADGHIARARAEWTNDPRFVALPFPARRLAVEVFSTAAQHAFLRGTGLPYATLRSIERRILVPKTLDTDAPTIPRDEAAALRWAHAALHIVDNGIGTRVAWPAFVPATARRDAEQSVRRSAGQRRRHHPKPTTHEP